MKSAKIIFDRTDVPLQVAVLVLDDSNTLSFAAAVDPMRAANRMAGRRLFDWSLITARGDPARLTSGIEVPGLPLAQLVRCDLAIVVAGFDLERHATPSLCAGLRRVAGTGTTLAGIDGGPWILARAGLLDGHRATTHWEDLDRLAQHFPSVTVLNDRFHIDGARMTSGGAMPAIDMMLHLIRSRYGDDLATRTAGAFIHDHPSDPAAAAIRAQSRAGSHPGHSALTARAGALMEQTLDAPLPIPVIARHCGTSPRSLEAQFRRRLATTPQRYYLQLRLGEARRLVRETDRPLMDIALATGFASQSSFARAYHAANGQSASAMRRAMQPSGPAVSL